MILASLLQCSYGSAFHPCNMAMPARTALILGAHRFAGGHFTADRHLTWLFQLVGRQQNGACSEDRILKNVLNSSVGYCSLAPQRRRRRRLPGNAVAAGLRSDRIMAVISSLVPARFLTLTAHLVIVITIFWSRGNNVLACLPVDYTQEQYSAADTQLIVALSVTLGMFAIELAGFMSGLSMFNSTQSVLSLTAHCSASVSLSLFVTQAWECTSYWYIFGFCSALPAITEIVIMIAVLGLKRKPL
ncbi:transmembrane protein 107 isoform X2 [Pseudophryne corroboree]|uniref:transmembrane protein 107 isoform X2 n=1 Tax=Pseudophryne corroboree TaxID=495146 RepID=UPI003081BD62